MKTESTTLEMRTVLVLAIALTLTWVNSSVGQKKQRSSTTHRPTSARKAVTPWTREQTSSVIDFVATAKRLEAIFNAGTPRDSDLYLKESSDFEAVAKGTAAVFPEGDTTKLLIQRVGVHYVNAGYAYGLDHPSESDRVRRDAIKSLDNILRKQGKSVSADPYEEEAIKFMQNYESLNPDGQPLWVVQLRVFRLAVDGRKLLEQGIRSQGVR
jgi:hypothetical protein